MFAGGRGDTAESSTPAVPEDGFLSISNSSTHISATLIKMANEPQNIRGLFLSAERARKEFASSYETNTPTYQENLSTAIATYEECLKLSEHVSLFSPNETLEDIASSDLQ